MKQSISAQYARLAAAGSIENDPAQQALAARFDALSLILSDNISRNRHVLRLLRPKAAPPRGLYVWGDVGRGKTMLMDMFFERVPVAKKRRAHFHAFMTDVHGRLHGQRVNGGRDVNPVEAAADSIADETALLCFDEFQVTDIADAMILSRLFGHLFKRGLVMVATSNTAPDRLYENGLNRALFLPFIETLKRNVDIVHLGARTDFRLEKLKDAPVWLRPADDKARTGMDRAFLKLTGRQSGEPEILRVQGRDLRVRNAWHDVARFEFDEVCKAPLGPADFGAIAGRYATVLIDAIPQLDAQPLDAVRRFVILIDQFYDRQVKLIASAAAEPDALLTRGKLMAEFRRTASRLVEMRSADWLALPHGPSVHLNPQGNPG